MRWTALALSGAMLLALAGRAAAEERWTLKFEYEPPQRILVPRHMPVEHDLYFGQQPYWYLLYRVTNLSKSPIPNMCLKVWVETDDRRRLARPFVVEKAPGVEGMEWETDRKEQPAYDSLGGRATWGTPRSTPLDPLRGAGACYVDSFLPLVHDAVAEKHGYRPKFHPSDRYDKGPNAALPALCDCFDVNDPEKPLGPGETRVGCAVFAYFPMEEYALFYDILNLLAVRAEERRTEANAEGFRKVRQYRELYPEGARIKYATELLGLEGNASGLDTAVDRILGELKSAYEEIGKAKEFDEEIALLVQAAKYMEAFRVADAVKILEEFRQKFPKSEFFYEADELYTLARQNLIPRAREEAIEIRRRHEALSIPEQADRIYVKATGLTDPVLKEGNEVFADEPVFVVVYHRSGDDAFRAFQELRKVEERWIPGQRRLIRKVARTKVGEY
jgi:hypothetical protein